MAGFVSSTVKVESSSVITINSYWNLFLITPGTLSFLPCRKKQSTMGDFLITILDWSEVWALLLPFSVFMLRRHQPQTLRPVIVYLWLALLINLSIDLIMMINTRETGFRMSNNPLYNTHSVVRFICFSIFFIRLPSAYFTRMKLGIALVAGVAVIVNFIFLENFFNFDSFSGNLMTTEAYLLLVYCMFYYLNELKDDQKNLFMGPEFWVVTGLAIYVVVNFFVFLFYLPMIEVDVDLAIKIWNLHNIAFIIFCLFLTRAFYGSFGYKPSV